MTLGKRRYIMAGMAAWLLLVPLAATSTNWSIRKLGGKRWQALHRLAYVSAICGVIHYWWIVKSGVRTPITITLVLAVLLLARIVWSVRQRIDRQAEVATARVGVILLCLRTYPSPEERNGSHAAAASRYFSSPPVSSKHHLDLGQEFGLGRVLHEMPRVSSGFQVAQLEHQRSRHECDLPRFLRVRIGQEGGGGVVQLLRTVGK